MADAAEMALDGDFKRLADWLKGARVSSLSLDREKGELAIDFADGCETLTVRAVPQDGAPHLNVYLAVPFHNFGIEIDG